MYCIWKDKRIPVKMWNGEILKPVYALDTETELIVNEQTPELIIGQAYDGDTAYIITASKMAGFLMVNLNPCTKVYFQNAKFDIFVTNLYIKRELWEWHVDNGRILDIGILYRLVRLAQMGIVPQRYSLAEMTMNLHSVKLNKDPLIRTTFGDGNLTEEHIVYAALDAVATFYDAKSVLAQMHTQDTDRRCLGHRLQLQADLALGAMQQHPINVDIPRAKILKQQVEREMMGQTIALVNMGYNPNVKGTKDRYDNVIKPILDAAGREIRYTAPNAKTGKTNISQSKEYLMPLMNDPFVETFLEYGSNQKLLTTFIKPMSQCGGQVYPRYELIKATGRTSCRKPNIQQQPRLGGVRECILPPEGYVFLGADYSYIELCTLAQWMYWEWGGERELCRLINSGQDPHYVTAALMLNKGIDKVTKDERQTAKALNFGIPGGLSAASLKGYAKTSYDVDLSDTEAEEYRNKWLKLYPDVDDYLNGYWSEVIMPNGRKRSECGYTVAHNTPFQALAADGIKVAMYDLYRAGQLDLNIMVHDELITTTPIADDYTEQAQHLGSVMVDGMRKVCPNVLIQAEAVAMDRWCKEAKPVLDNGKLLCYKEGEQ